MASVQDDSDLEAGEGAPLLPADTVSSPAPRTGTLSPAARSLAERTPLLLDKETIRQQLGLRPSAGSLGSVQGAGGGAGDERAGADGVADDDDYVATAEDPIGEALQRCYVLVIQPFGTFLCILGWRPFSFARTHTGNLVASNVYVALVALVLMCNYGFGVSYAVFAGRQDLLSEYIFQAVLSFTLWALGLWYFRREDGKAFQEISALIETVFLRCSDVTTGKLTQIALTNTLRLYLAYGVCALGMYLTVALWVAITSGLELFKEYDPPIWAFALLSVVVSFGYVAEYAVYICTIVIYYMWARLLMRYMDWLRDELTRRNIDLPAAEKEIVFIGKLVNDLNVGWAYALSTLSFSFLVLTLLYQVRIVTALSVTESWQAGIESAVAAVFTLISLYPAMTITWKGDRLKSMAWKLRGELPYRTASRDELDSFSDFFSRAPLTAKVLGFPLYPQIVYLVVLTITLAVVLLWRVGFYDAREHSGSSADGSAF
eukprot:Unigene9461_Nuclearia_a/m.28890 Unigene9461_Nuclearia_a/g.28890  ORF Unigene9461_Nuclearia_a/g.28890 Unigene9461_Nuclearia_a/m.28890 type:complete len:488 (-) Unigene9461_Nuclearia_a:66-1529(-)